MAEPTPTSLPSSWLNRTLFTYPQYWQLFTDVVAAGKTTGPVQSEELAHYTALNYKRSERIDKTVQVPADIHACVDRFHNQHTWLVLTEAWCGDAAQNLPYLHAMAQASGGKIELRLVLRDDNLDLMDQFQTNGTRSIPKLIGLDPANNVLYTWGPRPDTAQQIVRDWKANPVISKEEMYQQLHLWYARDRGVTLFHEFCHLLGGKAHA